jgi:hypothetical protein
VNRPYEALYIKEYLLATSIATATATVILSLSNKNKLTDKSKFEALPMCVPRQFHYISGHFDQIFEKLLKWVRRCDIIGKTSNPKRSYYVKSQAFSKLGER